MSANRRSHRTRTVRLAWAMALTLCGCGSDTRSVESPKSDGPSREASDEMKISDATARTTTEPKAETKTPSSASTDPIATRLAAEKRDRDVLSGRLRDLCARAARKETQAIEELERDFPSLAPHVVTLVVDQDSGKRRDACLKIAELGPDARGASVLIEQAFDAAPALEVGLAAGTSLDLADALIALAPDSPGTIARVMKLVGTPNRLGGLASQNSQAIDRLGALAAQSASARSRVVELLTPFLESSDERIRESAVKSLAACCETAELSLPALRKLKLDSSEGVRKAVAAAIGNIEIHVRFAPELKRAGLDEDTVGSALYGPAFDLAAGISSARVRDKGKVDLGTKVVAPTAGANFAKSKQALKSVRPGAPAVQTAVCLARLNDAEGLDRAAVRGLAFELLTAHAEVADMRPIMTPAVARFLDAAQPAATRAAAAMVVVRLAEDRSLAPQLIPALVPAADVPECSDAALRALASTGPEGARALKRRKSPAASKLEGLLLDRFKSAQSAARDKPAEGTSELVDALESLGALETESAETVRFLVRETYPKVPGGHDRPAAVSRAAAKALSHLGSGHFPFATAIRERCVNTFGGDAETTEVLKKVLKGMGVEDLSDLAYAVAVFTNSAATENQRDRARFDVIPRGNYEKLTEFLQQFAKKADGKARKACCATVWEDGSWIRASGDYGIQYSQVLIRCFPEESAEIVVPHIVEQLDIACTKKKGANVHISPLSAIELLIENAPRARDRVRPVLEKAAHFDNPRYDAAKVREQARAALDAYK